MNTNIKELMSIFAETLEKPWCVGSFSINGYERRKVWYDKKANKYTVTTDTGDVVNDWVGSEYDSFDEVISTYSSRHQVQNVVNMTKSTMQPMMTSGI